MKDSSVEVMAAVIAALKASAPLTALLAGGAAGIVDRAQADKAAPYVSLGTGYGEPAVETHGSDGFEVIVTLDTWSRYHGGRLEAHNVMAAITDVLHDAELTLATQTLVWGRLITQNTLADSDGVTTHGVQRFAFTTDA